MTDYRRNKAASVGTMPTPPERQSLYSHWGRCTKTRPKPRPKTRPFTLHCISRSIFLTNKTTNGAILAPAWSNAAMLPIPTFLGKKKQCHPVSFLHWLTSSPNQIRSTSGLKIIFERWPVVLTGQTNFSSIMSRFWPVKILKYLFWRISPISQKFRLVCTKRCC